MNRAVEIRVWPSLLAAVAMLTVVLGVGWLAAAQPLAPAGQLVAADPMPNARLPVAPAQIALTFPVPAASESARIRLLGAGGAEISLAPVQVAPNQPDRVQAAIPGSLPSGDYTVVWSVRSAADGKLLAGAYAFRAGVMETPGAVDLPGQWPPPWATLLRWLVFLGTAVAGGGFAWGRLLAARPGLRSPPSRMRLAAMAGAALAALLASALVPVAVWYAGESDSPASLLGVPRVMPPAWWLQSVALGGLLLICLGALARGTARAGRAGLDWAGMAAGLTALAGLGLTSRAASPLSVSAVAVELLHVWSTALWFAGVLFFLAGWRGMGSDVARFRTIRWVGGLLLAVSMATGVARAAQTLPAPTDLLTSRYGQVLLGKTGMVAAIVALGAVAMFRPRRANALQASRFLGAQGQVAGLAALLAALLALMAPPGPAMPATLAGVTLADVVALDRDAFGAERGMIHLLTQPVTPGPQTLVARLTATDGASLPADQPPTAQITWTALGDQTAAVDPIALEPDPAGVTFTGAVTLEGGWWEAEVVITPPGGIASRARFWLAVPDPNVAGAGPISASDPEAMALFDRGLRSLTTLQSVRYSQRLTDGSGSLTRSRIAVTAARGEQPAAYAETVIDADGAVAGEQRVVGNRRWLLEEGVWVAAEPIPFQVPAAWGAAYTGATGFQSGPRETIDGELSQVVTFWVPTRGGSSRAPAWYAWWVGLASGEVRREAMITARHYTVAEFGDFDAPLDIEPPVAAQTPPATPTRAVAPRATPEGEPAANIAVPNTSVTTMLTSPIGLTTGDALMATSTVRIRPHTYRVLQDMAKARGGSLPDALDRIVEDQRRAQMFQEANAAYAAIAADPVEGAHWRAEIATWDGTLPDGLEPESRDEE